MGLSGAEGEEKLPFEFPLASGGGVGTVRFYECFEQIISFHPVQKIGSKSIDSCFFLRSHFIWKVHWRLLYFSVAPAKRIVFKPQQMESYKVSYPLIPQYINLFWLALPS